MTEKLTPSAVRTGFEKRARQMRGGLQKHLPANTTLVVKGVAYTQVQLVQAMQEAERLCTEVRDARAVLRQKLLDRQVGLRPLAELHSDLALSLKGYFGRTSAKLSELGVRSGARSQRSVHTNVLAQAKARMTRAARHTMGRKQKLAIKGVGSPSLIVFDSKGEPVAALPPVASVMPKPDAGHGPSG
jgi:hypothetical protein